MIEVGTLLSIIVCSLLNLDKELSKTLTLAPKPMAAFVANSPTIPAPKTTTSVGRTPVIPPSIKPLDFANNSDAYKMEIPPAISPMSLISDNWRYSSIMNSKAMALTFFLLIF